MLGPRSRTSAMLTEQESIDHEPKRVKTDASKIVRHGTARYQIQTVTDNIVDKLRSIVCCPEIVYVVDAALSILRPISLIVSAFSKNF